MGCTPNDDRASPAGIGIRNPDQLEAIQTSNGLWWLAVFADPERIAVGTFGSENTALAHRQWLIDQRKRMEPVERARQQADHRLHEGLELARAVDSFAQELQQVAATLYEQRNALQIPADYIQRLFTIRNNLNLATHAFREAVGHG